QRLAGCADDLHGPSHWRARTAEAGGIRCLPLQPADALPAAAGRGGHLAGANAFAPLRQRTIRTRGQHAVKKPGPIAFVLALLLAPLAMPAQSPPDAFGNWRGTLQAGAVKLRLALHLGETSTFDSLDQGALGLPARLSVDGRRITVAVEQVGSIEGELSEDGNT